MGVVLYLDKFVVLALPTADNLDQAYSVNLRLEDVVPDVGGEQLAQGYLNILILSLNNLVVPLDNEW